MLRRAVVIKKLLVAEKVFGGGGGYTSHELAVLCNCTPSTVRNTVRRYGKLVGIGYRLVEHRPSIKKSIYYPVDLHIQPELF